MKCFNHPDVDATAICTHCGLAVCAKCITRSKSGRAVCSTTCSAALERYEQAFLSMHLKGLSGFRIIGYLTISSALVLACFGFVALHDGIWPLAALCFAFTAIFVVIGAVVFRMVKRKEREGNGR